FRAERVDHHGHLMPRNPGILNAGPEALFREQIAVTNAAGLDLYPDRADPRLRDLPLDELKRPFRTPHLHHPHRRHPRRRRAFAVPRSMPDRGTGEEKEGPLTPPTILV